MGAAPRVSVIMPAHNAERFIARGMASALAQTERELELIVIDDGSGDRTAEVARECADPRVRVLQQSQSGVSRARNRGLAEARGEWVAFLDSDDEWEPDFLQSLLAALADRPDAALAYCGWQNVGLPGARGLPFVPPDLEVADKLHALLEDCPWPIHAAVTRRATLLDAGGFPVLYSHAEDYALWLEVAAFRPIVRVPRVLAYYHWHDGPRASHHRARMAIQRRMVQREFIARHPEVVEQVGRKEVDRLIDQALLHQGFEAYWSGDLVAARGIFRRAMSLGLGSSRQWLRMAPAWLPESLHRQVLQLLR